MKKIYSRPETEIIDIETQQMICTSGDTKPTPENEEWFDTTGKEETPISSWDGELD